MLSYPEFAARYTDVVAQAARAWFEADPQTRETVITNAENALTQANTNYHEYVNRLALLGPALGGTVLAQNKQDSEV